MAVLAVTEGAAKGKRFVLQDQDSVVVSLGRDPSLGISLEDQNASRRHAQIKCSSGMFQIVDLNSSNGTYVNDQKITEQVLADGDVITVGKTKLTFEANELSESEVHVHDREDFLELAVDLESLEFDGLDKDQAAALEKERKKLKTIYRVSEVIGTQLNRDKLMEDIMDSIFEVFPQADRGFLMFRDEANVLYPKAVRTRGALPTTGEKLSVSRTVVGMTLNEGKAILSSDTTHDERFAEGESIMNLKIRSLMCVPMLHAGECIGVIHIDTMDQSKKFVQDDLSLLQGIARQTAIAIKNSMLLEAIELETAKRTSLQRFLSPALVEKVMSKELDLKLGGDIKPERSFSPTSSALPRCPRRSHPKMWLPSSTATSTKWWASSSSTREWSTNSPAIPSWPYGGSGTKAPVPILTHRP